MNSHNTTKYALLAAATTAVVAQVALTDATATAAGYGPTEHLGAPEGQTVVERPNSSNSLTIKELEEIVTVARCRSCGA